MKREREELGEDAPPKQIPKTLETLREPDETVVDDNDEEDNFDITTDEYANYFSKEYDPKVLITSSANPLLVRLIK